MPVPFALPPQGQEYLLGEVASRISRSDVAQTERCYALLMMLYHLLKTVRISLFEAIHGRVQPI